MHVSPNQPIPEPCRHCAQLMYDSSLPGHRHCRIVGEIACEPYRRFINADDPDMAEMLERQVLTSRSYPWS